MASTASSKTVVRVKEKFQVTLPSDLRKRAGVAVGDFLEIKVGSGGVITLTPKSFVDRHIAQGLADVKAGRLHGPYSTADEAIRMLDRKASRRTTKR